MTTERILSKKQTANDGILAKRRDSVWHFVTKSTGLKSVNPGKSSHFSESRNPSYVSWATCPKCLRKERWISPSGYSLHPTHGKAAQNSSMNQVAWLHLQTCLVPSWCGARGTIWDCCWSWGISSPPIAAVSASVSNGKESTKMSEWMSM